MLVVLLFAVAVAAEKFFGAPILSPRFTVPSQAVSLLLVGPALFLSWMARAPEHRALAVMLLPLTEHRALAVMLLPLRLMGPLTVDSGGEEVAMALNRKKIRRHESPRQSVLSDARIDLGAGSQRIEPGPS